MADNFQGHEKVELKTVLLTSLISKQSVNIIPLVRNIDVFCSIFTPVITGKVRVIDATGIVQNLPIVGEEILELVFQTPNREEFSKLFHVYGIENQEYNDNGAAVSFTLRMATIDNFKATATSVNRGARKNISELVRDILTENLKTENELNIEDTNGVEHIVIPNWSIWESIEYLRNRAVSAEYASPYLFFEDQKGYNFVTYEKLIEQRRARADELIYTNESFKPEAGEGQGQITVLNSQVRNVNQFEIINRANAISRVQDGGMSSEVLLYDPFTKTLKTNQYNFNDLSTLVKRPLADAYHAEHSQGFANNMTSASQRVVLAVDSTNLNSISQEAVGAKQLFTSAIGGTCVGFNTNGDSGVQPGDVIHIVGPSRAESPDPDKQITGKYIIGSLKHGILDGAMFDTIEAYRFGFNEEIIPTPEPVANTAAGEILEPITPVNIQPLELVNFNIVTQNTSNAGTNIDGIRDIVDLVRGTINNISSAINVNIDAIRDRIGSVQNIVNLSQTDILTQFNSVLNLSSSIRSEISQLQNLSNIRTLLPPEILSIYDSIQSISSIVQNQHSVNISDISSIFNIINSNISTIQNTSGSPLEEVTGINTQITALHQKTEQLNNYYREYQNKRVSVERLLERL